MTTGEAIAYLQRVADFAALNGGSEAFQVALNALYEKAERDKAAAVKPVRRNEDQEAAAM